jgi:hypothetical protein
MQGCPLAYTDPCSKCPQFGNCSPSQAVQKLATLEGQLKDLKSLVEQLAKKN